MIHEASRDLEVRASGRDFIDLVWDFGRYPQFVSGIRATEVMSRGDTHTLVRLDASLLGVGFSYVLDCRREGDKRVSWKRTAGSFREAFGAWTVLEEGGGAARVRYENSVDPGFPAPSFAVKWILERSLPTLLEEMKREAETRAAARVARETGAKS